MQEAVLKNTNLYFHTTITIASFYFLERSLNFIEKMYGNARYFLAFDSIILYPVFERLWRPQKKMRSSSNFKIWLTVSVFLVGTGYTPTAFAHWEERAKLLASDGRAGDYFGGAVAISGDTAIIGAPSYGNDDTDAGSAYIFGCVGSNWIQQAKLSTLDGEPGDWFGKSVSISGDYAIVGAPCHDENGSSSGAAYVFNRVGASWFEQAKLTASDAASHDWFGQSVSISGDYLIVGAHGDDDNGDSSGSAYVFMRDGTNWIQQFKMTAWDGAAGDYFGLSVSISGDYTLVGAPYHDNIWYQPDAGSAYISAVKLTASDGGGYDYFGASVSTSGEYAIVGAFCRDGVVSNSGSAYIFDRATFWHEQAKLAASDGASGDCFGYSVSINGEWAVVGSPGAGNSGSAYTFERDGTNWAEQQKLTASDADPNDLFGHCVCISGDYIIVGAQHDEDKGAKSGSAYVFGPGIAPGKLRFYVEKNGQAGYQDGQDEPVTNEKVYYKIRTTADYTTASDGTVSIDGLKAGDWIFVRHLAYEQDAVKGDRDFAGSMFDLYQDTDSVSGTGELQPYKITNQDIAKINNGEDVNIPLSHPVFSWNLVVALNWDADTSYLDKLKRGLRHASNYLFDVTDGQMKLGKIDIRTNVPQNSEVWTQNSDVRIHASSWYLFGQWPTTIGRVTYATGHVDIPQYFNPWLGPWQGDPDSEGYYRPLVHELGHYVLFFWDEYQNGNYSELAWTLYRLLHPEEVPDNYGLMDDSYYASEMSSNNDYLESYADYSFPQDKNRITEQIWLEELLLEHGVHLPCWQHLSHCFDNGDGNLTQWNGYNGIRVTISMPPDGVFQGHDALGAEVRTSDDRAGPEAVREPYKSCEFAPGDGLGGAGSGTSDTLLSKSKLTANFRSEGLATNSDGNEPRLVLDAGVTDPNILRIKVVSDRALVQPPTVQVRPWFGDPCSVTMSQTEPNIYEGTVDIRGALEGSVDVSAVGSGGQTDTSTIFRIQQLLTDQPSTIYSPEGWLDAHFPYDVLGADTLAVSIGSGNAPIAPSDQCLIFLTEPVSFHLENGVSVGPVYTINWHLNPDNMAGIDANTLALGCFDQNTRQWEEVPASFMVGLPVISASDVNEGIYAVFAQESNDLAPPGVIADLNAVTGQAGWSVILNWTAPGDDANHGQAVRYHVLFSTEPITDPNCAECLELPMRDTPKPAGEAEQHAFEMPDPDTYYYFAVLAVDEAGNTGPISNIAEAKSYAQDTDGDGLADQWEQAYGFDPCTPGDELLDPDADGLNNLQEYRFGTLPKVWDTDGDGISDGVEFVDFVVDGHIDFRDYCLFAIHWLEGCTMPDRCTGTDLDWSGMVNIADLATFVGHWLEGTIP